MSLLEVSKLEVIRVTCALISIRRMPFPRAGNARVGVRSEFQEHLLDYILSLVMVLRILIVFSSIMSIFLLTFCPSIHSCYFSPISMHEFADASI